MPELPSDILGRQLLNEGVVHLVPLIEVIVEPGISSDQSKLGYNYTVEFVDSRTIQIVIEW